MSVVFSGGMLVKRELTSRLPMKSVQNHIPHFHPLKQTRPEIRVDNIFKNLVTSNSISGETRRSLKPVGTRPSVICELSKVNKDIVENCPLLWPI